MKIDLDESNRTHGTCVRRVGVRAAERCTDLSLKLLYVDVEESTFTLSAGERSQNFERQRAARA